MRAQSAVAERVHTAQRLSTQPQALWPPEPLGHQGDGPLKVLRASASPA